MSNHGEAFAILCAAEEFDGTAGVVTNIVRTSFGGLTALPKSLTLFGGALAPLFDDAFAPLFGGNP